MLWLCVETGLDVMIMSSVCCFFILQFQVCCICCISGASRFSQLVFIYRNIMKNHHAFHTITVFFLVALWTRLWSLLSSNLQGRILYIISFFLDKRYSNVNYSSDYYLNMISTNVCKIYFCQKERLWLDNILTGINSTDERDITEKALESDREVCNTDRFEW